MRRERLNGGQPWYLTECTANGNVIRAADRPPPANKKQRRSDLERKAQSENSSMPKNARRARLGTIVRFSRAHRSPDRIARYMNDTTPHIARHVRCARDCRLREYVHGCSAAFAAFRVLHLLYRKHRPTGIYYRCHALLSPFGLGARD
jgi:hypothetical protein